MPAKSDSARTKKWSLSNVTLSDNFSLLEDPVMDEKTVTLAGVSLTGVTVIGQACCANIVDRARL